MTAILRVNVALTEYTGGIRLITIIEGTSVRAILLKLHIPSDIVALVLANGEAVDKEYMVQIDDLIEIHPIIGGG